MPACEIPKRRVPSVPLPSLQFRQNKDLLALKFVIRNMLLKKKCNHLLPLLSRALFQLYTNDNVLLARSFQEFRIRIYVKEQNQL